MLVAVLALVVVAATAAVVIRDAHPRPPKAIPAVPDAAVDAAPEPERADYPTQAVDMTQLGAMDESGLDAPTQSMTMPVAFAGGQAAAVLPYPTAPQPVPAAEPAAQPAAFVPAGVPHLQPDPDRLIQTEIVIEDPEREHDGLGGRRRWTRDRVPVPRLPGLGLPSSSQRAQRVPDDQDPDEAGRERHRHAAFRSWYVERPCSRHRRDLRRSRG